MVVVKYTTSGVPWQQIYGHLLNIPPLASSQTVTARHARAFERRAWRSRYWGSYPTGSAPDLHRCAQDPREPLLARPCCGAPAVLYRVSLIFKVAEVGRDGARSGAVTVAIIPPYAFQGEK